MATPNYGYEKRQKELAKKRKTEDKLRAKADRKAGILPPSSGDANPSETNGLIDPNAPGSGQMPPSGN